MAGVVERRIEGDVMFEILLFLQINKEVMTTQLYREVYICVHEISQRNQISAEPLSRLAVTGVPSRP